MLEEMIQARLRNNTICNIKEIESQMNTFVVAGEQASFFDI